MFAEWEMFIVYSSKDTRINFSTHGFLFPQSHSNPPAFIPFAVITCVSTTLDESKDKQECKANPDNVRRMGWEMRWALKFYFFFIKYVDLLFKMFSFLHFLLCGGGESITPHTCGGQKTIVWIGSLLPPHRPCSLSTGHQWQVPPHTIHLTDTVCLSYNQHLVVWNF